MTLEELKTLKPGEVVVITKIDKNINSSGYNGTLYKNYEVGEELTFISNDYWVDFYRTSNIICHFTEKVCDYIERKTILQRNNKLIELGIQI
jgi:hypothetical protein